MKFKLVLSLWVTLLIGQAAMAQKPDDNYSLYSNPNYYKGKTIFFIRDISERKTVDYLFKKPTGEYDADNVPYPEEPKKDMIIYYSKLDSLLGKKFICQDMVTVVKYVSPYHYLKLYNEKTGIIYLDVTGRRNIATQEQLDAEKADSLERVAEAKAKLKEDADYQKQLDNPCLGITKSYDEFHYTTTYSTPLGKPEDPHPGFYDTRDGNDYLISFDKVIKKGVATYYMYMWMITSSSSDGGRGVIIILKNGKRINKPSALATSKYSKGGYYRLSSLIELNSADIALLKQSPVKAYELHHSQREDTDGEDLRKMLLCLLTKK